MPRKRNNAWSRNKKEKQLLIGRLMEISLKVDDYIYKHRPISEPEAAEYIREVVSYKTLCAQDERSLQVIEKLTRCMKAIIAEHQELRGDSGDSGVLPCHDTRACSISPVYSVCDEDRTQFTQIALNGAKNVDKVQTEAIETIDLCDIDDDDDASHNEIANIATQGSSSRINVEVDIHRAISNLSIIEVEDPQEITYSDANFSQSILNNFEDNTKLRQNNINIHYKGAHTRRLMDNADDKEQSTNASKTNSKIINMTKLNNSFGKIQIDNSRLTIKPVNTYMSKSNDAQNQAKDESVINLAPINIIKSTNYNVMNASKHTDTKASNRLYPISYQIRETQSRTNNTSNTILTVNNSSHILKDAINSKQLNTVVNSNSITDNNSANVSRDMQNERPINLDKTLITKSNKSKNKEINNATAINNANSSIIKKKRGPRKKKIEVEKNTKPKNKRSYHTPKRLSDKSTNNNTNSVEKQKNIPIYNTNVENDLSWLENIRYVREIIVDEKDPKLDLEETFWDNYYLPANWNESEFM